MPKRRRAKWTLDLRTEAAIHLQAASGPIVERPWIAQHMETYWPGIAGVDMCADGIKHTFDLGIFEYMLGPIGRGDKRNPGDRLLEELAPYGIEGKPDVLTEERLLVARTEITELPVHLVEASGGWFHVLDAMGEEGDVLAEMIADLTDENSPRHVELALLDGAFLWPRTLAVHPKFRGQGLGIRLLAHALFALHRCGEDLAGFGIGTVSSCFDAEQATLTPEMTRRFRRYYGRIGFKRWKNDENIVYLPLGYGGMPVRGLPGLQTPPEPE